MPGSGRELPGTCNICQKKICRAAYPVQSAPGLRLGVLPGPPTDNLRLDYLASRLIEPFAAHTTAGKRKRVSAIVVLAQ